MLRQWDGGYGLSIDAPGEDAFDHETTTFDNLSNHQNDVKEFI